MFRAEPLGTSRSMPVSPAIVSVLSSGRGLQVDGSVIGDQQLIDDLDRDISCGYRAATVEHQDIRPGGE